MISNEDKFYIKIVSLDAIYNFAVRVPKFNLTFKFQNL